MTAALRRLVGDWEGSGTGSFPTVEPFRYRERLTVRESGHVLHYVQRTWRPDAAGERPSHLETGYIAADDDGTIRMLNAQGDDRVEILEGPASVDGAVLRIRLDSVVIAGDSRVLRTWRSLTCTADELAYELGMATTAVPDGAAHLAITLAKA